VGLEAERLLVITVLVLVEQADTGQELRYL